MWLRRGVRGGRIAVLLSLLSSAAAVCVAGLSSCGEPQAANTSARGDVVGVYAVSGSDLADQPAEDLVARFMASRRLSEEDAIHLVRRALASELVRLELRADGSYRMASRLFESDPGATPEITMGNWSRQREIITLAGRGSSHVLRVLAGGEALEADMALSMPALSIQGSIPLRLHRVVD